MRGRDVKVECPLQHRGVGYTCYGGEGEEEEGLFEGEEDAWAEEVEEAWFVALKR